MFQIFFFQAKYKTQPQKYSQLNLSNSNEIFIGKKMLPTKFLYRQFYWFFFFLEMKNSLSIKRLLNVRNSNNIHASVWIFRYLVSWSYIYLPSYPFSYWLFFEECNLQNNRWYTFRLALNIHTPIVAKRILNVCQTFVHRFRDIN